MGNSHARRTINRMLALEELPTYRRRQPKRVHKLGPHKERIQELLIRDLRK